MLSKSQHCLVARLLQETTLSERKIACIAKCSRPSVSKCKSVITQHHLSWQQLEQMDREALEAAFYPNRLRRSSQKHHPNHADTHNSLMANKLLTTRHCWLRHCEKEGRYAVGRSTFYNGYRGFRKMQKLSMRMEHRGGEIAQVDYAGTVLRYPQKRKLPDLIANIFVAVYPCSNYIFAHTTPGQTMQDWIEAHVAFLETSGGSTDTIMPDNPKALVTKANPEKVLNANYEAFSKWYGVSILPTRVRHPQDKACVENEVGHITDAILADMKGMHFTSLEAINAYLKVEIDKLNNKPFQKRNSTRALDFKKWDKPFLSPLPEKPFKIIEQVFNIKVPEDYMVLVDGHFYSVPYKYAHKPVEIHLTRKDVTVLYDMKAIACHERSVESGKMTRLTEHMHPNHAHMDSKTVEFYLEWAAPFGDHTQALLQAQFDSSYQNSFRANQICRSIQKFFKEKEFTQSEFENACQYVMKHCKRSLTELKHVLASGMYKDVATSQPDALLYHSNVRGSEYYDQHSSGSV